MKEQLQEASRRFEQADQFPVGLRDGIGNSTLTEILTNLQTDHTLGDEKSIGAISRFLGCFEPIATPSSNQPESLWDQTATAVMAYRHLNQEDQEQMNGMVDTILWSLANTPQERKVNGHTKDISPHVRKLATTIGLTTDTWEYITEPKHYVKQRKLRIHPKMATASALAAVSVIAACSPARPTITPEITRPAITQPTQITELPATPTKTPEPTNTLIPTPTETPPPEEFLSQIPADKQYEIVNGQVLVDGQAWFELNDSNKWEMSDGYYNHLLTLAPNQNFWEEKYQIQKVWRQHIWPVLTGENLEVVKEINGQPVIIKGRLAVIPNPYQPGKILTVLAPYRYEWGDGLFIEWGILEREGNEEVSKGVDYFLQLPGGKQLCITAAIDSAHKPAECTFGTRCGWVYDVADLSADFFLKGVTPEEPVIVSPVSIQVK